MAKIGVLGGGSWGIALALLLYKNGHDVTIWSALSNEVEMLDKEREHKMLPGVTIPKDMQVTGEIETVVANKDLLILSVASRFIRATAHKISPFVPEKQKILNVAKGIEDDTLLTLSKVIEEEIPRGDIAVLSGPSHAEEVSQGIPTTVVVGAKSKRTAEYIQNLFMNEAFRVYISPDITGIELGGSLKNVVALAAGIADGLGCGDNSRAALITRGIAEISRLGVEMGGNFETFSGLTGMGDLIVTCASMHSRNRRAGILIGQGKSYEEAMAEVKMVVEGVYSAKAAMKLSEKYHVQMPIIEQVNEVLFQGKSPEQAVKDLMLRGKREECSDLAWEEE